MLHCEGRRRACAHTNIHTEAPTRRREAKVCLLSGVCAHETKVQLAERSDHAFKSAAAGGTTWAAAGAGAAAARAALVGLSFLTHLVLCPAFQCFFWHAVPQYHDCWQRPQRLGAPSLPQHSHTGIAQAAAIELSVSRLLGKQLCGDEP